MLSTLKPTLLLPLFSNADVAELEIFFHEGEPVGKIKLAFPASEICADAATVNPSKAMLRTFFIVVNISDCVFNRFIIFK